MIRRLSVISAGLLLSLLLAGCAVVPAPTASSPDPTVAPSPTAAPSTLPQPTLPVACADVFGEQDVTALLDTAVTLVLDETTVRTSFDAAMLQVGALSCTWGGATKTDNSWDQSLVFTVLPHADTDFDLGVWQVDDGAIVYPDGELSEYLCDQNTLNGCRANVLLDGYWAQAQVRSPAIAERQMRTIVDAIRSAISSASEPRPLWTAPSPSLVGNYCGPEEPLGGGALAYLQFVAQARSKSVSCATPDNTFISIVPNAAWAVPLMATYGEGPFWSVEPLEPVELPGSEGAVGATTAEGGYYLVVAANGSAIGLSSGLPAEEFLAQAPALVAEIVAAG